MKTQEEIEKLTDKWYTEKHQMIPSIIEQKSFINGYTQCQEDMADKKYTEEDVINIVNKSRETGLTAEYLILQLNKQD